jgi:hypothetical protein
MHGSVAKVASCFVMAVALQATRLTASEGSWARTVSPPVVRAAPALAAGYMTRRIHPPVSAVILENFLLEPAGIRFGMHPTEARITVTAKADALLKVCQVGTTFSSHWTGGCLRLGRRQLALPTSGGAVHVGFRVLPRDGGLTRVARLRVRWHCVDHYFSLLPGTTEIRRVRPLFDC